MKCIFCNEIKEEQILLETASFKVIFDSDPIQLGHLLIISKINKVLKFILRGGLTVYGSIIYINNAFVYEVYFIGRNRY
ncbi:hypothetical protein BW721_10235 [Jeotgalibaca sp. PTS2502]|nr:hypothetical protein BW721_10235 [Jeotgalibaca sp. PTS2502]